MSSVKPPPEAIAERIRALSNLHQNLVEKVLPAWLDEPGEEITALMAELFEQYQAELALLAQLAEPRNLSETSKTWTLGCDARNTQHVYLYDTISRFNQSLQGFMAETMSKASVEYAAGRITYQLGVVMQGVDQLDKERTPL